MKLSFTVPGPPLTWKRTNVVGKRKLTDAKMLAYQRHAKSCASAALLFVRNWPKDARYAVTIEVYPKTNARSDVDNFSKQMDSWNRVAWDDDSQVDDLRVVRMPKSDRPRMEVTIEVIERRSA